MGKRSRLLSSGLKPIQADFFVQFVNYDDLLEFVIANSVNQQEIILAANYLSSDLASIVKNEGIKVFENINRESFLELIKMVSENKISSRGAKDILLIMAIEGGMPNIIATEKCLIQQSDSGEIEKIADQVIAENQAVVEDYKNGKEASIRFLMGQGMKISKGSANPQALEECIKSKIL